MATADPETSMMDNVDVITASQWPVLKLQPPAILKRVKLMCMRFYMQLGYWIAIIHTAEPEPATYIVGKCPYLDLDGDRNKECHLTEIDNVRGLNIKDICIGGSPRFALLLDISGIVWSAGNNNYYSLGREGVHTRFMKLNLTNVSQIAVGSLHCLAVTSENQVFAWGANWHGQVGNGKRGEPRCWVRIPVRVFPMDADVLGQGDTSSPIARIACGLHHSVALLTTGKLLIWGYKSDDQPRPVDLNITEVVCGARHMLAVGDAGQIFTWGSNERGQLGTGKKVDQYTPVKVEIPGKVLAVRAAGETSLAITLEGQHCKCYIWGYYKKEEVLKPRLVSNVNFPTNLLVDGKRTDTGGSVRLDYERVTEMRTRAVVSAYPPEGVIGVSI